MGSPIGGFYISAINRRKKDIFENSNRVQIILSICFEKEGNAVSNTFKVFIGQEFEFRCNACIIKLETQILASGLLKAVFEIEDDLTTYKQAFNLAPKENVTSLIDANQSMKMTVSARRYSGEINYEKKFID